MRRLRAPPHRLPRTGRRRPAAPAAPPWNRRRAPRHRRARPERRRPPAARGRGPSSTRQAAGWDAARRRGSAAAWRSPSGSWRRAGAGYAVAVPAASIAVLRGDQTGQELLEQALRVLSPDVIGVDLELHEFDLSLEHRRATQNAVVAEAADAMVRFGFGLKAATVTPEKSDDVGSPNALLRERVGGKVILRTGRRIPGVPGIAGVSAPISVVRMAVDDAYNAREWREPDEGDEVAFRTEHISRATCRAVAEFAFLQAERMGARVFGGPKYTVSRIYEGMFKEEMDAAAARHPAVTYEPQLIDATYALVFSRGTESLVIPALNRDGDCLSDFVLQLFG